jgi:hypothetical protein
MTDETMPLRCVLEGVPEVKFYDGGPRCPEDLALPSVMRALMEYFDENDFGCRTCRAVQPGCKINCSYSFFVGVSGAASFLSWKKGWEGDNGALFYMSDDPAAPENWAFRAAGYATSYLGKETVTSKDESEARRLFRQRIVEQIRRGHPVVAYGVVGPPEPAIITGYDDGGDVLIGWSFFQKIPDFNAGVEFEPSGYFRKRDWFKDTEGLMFIGEKRARPPLKELYRDALQWMLKVARVPAVHPGADAPEWYRERANGIAAYQAWADQLLEEQEFPADEALRFQRHDVHNNAVGTVAEARWYGAQFLIQASDPDILHYAMAADLLHAAACYAAEHDLMWKVWDLAGGNGNPQAYQRFADPGVRRQMVPVILEAQRQDAMAADHIERALAFYQ